MVDKKTALADIYELGTVSGYSPTVTALLCTLRVGLGLAATISTLRRLLGQPLGIDNDPIQHTDEMTLVLDPAGKLIRRQPQLVPLGDVPPSDNLPEDGVLQLRLQG